MLARLLPSALLLAALSPPSSHAQAPTQLADLADLSLEQLSRVTVSSAVRREQPLLEAPASLFVITAEDIRRSGMATLPEVLRMAPNLQVMRGDTSQYVVSARGGLTTTANKMLVLVDGRTLYTPLFSGVFYDAFAVPIEDIERIEVISGPGATLWGTNAVNGVINVTTRRPRSTLGSLVAGGAGNQERGVIVRHGWQAGAETAVRAHARYFERDSHELEAGGSALDAAERWQVGARAERDAGGTITNVQGAAYGAKVGNLGGERDLSGAHVLARWRQELGAGASSTLQAYYDRTERKHARTFEETRNTFDIEGQSSRRFGDAHLVALGAGYRASRDRTVPTQALGFMPPERTLRHLSLYAQDEIRLSPALVAIAGARVERNTYTGWEWLPSLRLSYAMSPSQVAWGALSRAVRTPSRIDADLVVPGFAPFVLTNNPGFDSEVAEVAEVGYRARFGPLASLSLGAFHHRFDRLRTVEATSSGLILTNGAEGRLNGIEAWGDLRPLDDWRLVWGFAFMRHTTQVLPGRSNQGEDPLGNNPRRTASLRSLWNVNERLQVDLFARHVSRLPNPAIPAYTQLNARVGWRVSRHLELSLIGSNLAQEHVEFGGPAVRATFGPSYFAKATWSY